MSTATARQVTLRLPDPLYRAAKEVAERRRTSINRLAREGLERVTRDDLAAQMRAAYDALGADAEGADVAPYLAAQSEVVLREPA